MAVKVFVRVGSRHDGERHGIAHLLEHALFRGATGDDVTRALEAVGGRLQGETTKDYLALSAVAAPQHLRACLQTLSDLLLYPAFEPEGLAAEKAVILQEMARRSDSRQILWDLYDLSLWQSHPLRHRVLGYESSVAALTDNDLQAHYRRFCVPPAMVVVVSGDCDADMALAKVERHFAEFAGQAPAYPAADAEPLLTERRESRLDRATGQTHLALGWPTVPLRHPDGYALKVVDWLLGKGSHSRLYRELRLRQRLYEVHTARAEHEDTGHFCIYTAANPGQTEQVLQSLLAQVRCLQDEPITQDELRIAQASYAGSLPVSFETNVSLAGIVGLETLLAGEFEPFAESARRVESVTPEDVLRVANGYFDTERYALATVGPRGDGA